MLFTFDGKYSFPAHTQCIHLYAGVLQSKTFSIYHLFKNKRFYLSTIVRLQSLKSTTSKCFNTKCNVVMMSNKNSTVTGKLIKLPHYTEAGKLSHSIIHKFL